jgi:predicted transcriptional regulator
MEACLVENEMLILTAEIVSAHVANNDVAVQQLPALIRNVHKALSTVGRTAAEPITAEPTVAVKKSVFADRIVCLGCGESFRLLKRHILADHQMTPDQYRTKWGLPPSYPLVAAEYAAARSKLAFASGLGRKAVVPVPKKRRRQPKNK